MAAAPNQNATHQLEMRLGVLLRIGVSMAAALVFLGGALYLVRHGHEHPAYETFHGEPSELRTLSGIVRGAADLQAPSIIQLGLMLLIATPVARVAFAAFAFGRQRDWLYLGIASIVLALLLYGLIP